MPDRITDAEENRSARCGRPTLAVFMSMFNTDILCLDCKTV
jgi:hypothetical protein